MKEKIQKLKKVLKWAIPAYLVIFACIFYKTVHGHSFLGFLCLCLTGVILCYYFLNWLKKRQYPHAKLLTRIFTAILCVGLVMYAVAEVLVIGVSFGQPERECKYIVVLGAKVNDDQPSLTLQERIDKAYDYLVSNPDTVAVLSGGQGEDEKMPESVCMYAHLTAKGIDPDRLWVEDKSTSTWENLNFSLDIIEEKTGAKPESIGILSSEYHLFRAGLFAKECGVEAVGIPAKTSWFSIRLNYFLREAAGVWHYIILGG